MPIDTEDKRRSAIASEIDSFTIPQVPRGTFVASDRRHDTAFYRGIDTVFDSFVFWREDSDKVETWSQDSDAGSTSQPDDDAPDIWVKTEEVRD